MPGRRSNLQPETVHPQGRTPLECRGRSKFRPLRRHKMQASSTDGSKGRMVLNACLVWDFSDTHSGPVTAAVAGFSSARGLNLDRPIRVAEILAKTPIFAFTRRVLPNSTIH